MSKMNIKVNSKKNIVWISPYAPYDNVDHAGGKNHNFFLKYIHRKDMFNIKLLTVCEENEVSKLDLDIYGINNQVKIYPAKGFKGTFRKIINIESSLNPFKYGGGILSNYRFMLLKKLIKLNSRELAVADIVIMQWTQALLLLPYIRKFCKGNVTFVSIEEDVAFLGYERKYKIQSKGLYKAFKKEKYNKLKKAELACLSKCDVICVLNDKDKRLLLDNEVNSNNILVTPNYFERYTNVNSCNSGYNIMFFGQMGRKENSMAVEWFIDNVMPLLPEQYKLYVVGSNPPQNLVNKKSSRIIITGFVDDIREYLSNTLCMVAPLLLGAGIKVKILEGMSAGKVILTNDIGAEGIPIKDGVDYIHCKTAKDYADAIVHLHNDNVYANTIGNNARKVIEQGFNVEKGLDNLCKMFI